MVFKKLFFVIFAASTLSVQANKKCICNEPEFGTVDKIILGVELVLIAPALLPVPVSMAIYAATTKAAAYVGSMSVLGKIGLGVSAAQLARPYVLQTTEEHLNTLLKEKASRSTQSKSDFISCLKKNRKSDRKNASGIPEACEGAALRYAFSAGVAELNKKTKAFKDGQCFCG